MSPVNANMTATSPEQDYDYDKYRVESDVENLPENGTHIHPNPLIFGKEKSRFQL